MTKRRDLTGMKFGRLTVLEYDSTVNGKAYWKCICDCGKCKITLGTSLVRGDTKSCGCLWAETILKSNTRHSFSRRNGDQHIRNIHRGMLERCCNPKNIQYKNYGGRGIRVCDEWHDLKIFGEWATSNGCEHGLQIDRVNNDGNYEPSNCRFATPEINANNRRTTKMVEINGVTKPLVLWAKESGILPWTIYNRLKAGYAGDILLRKGNLND